MKKITRDLKGSTLIKLLEKFQYEVIRQTGSHIRIKTTLNGRA